MTSDTIDLRVWHKLNNEMLHIGWNGDNFYTVSKLLTFGESAIVMLATGLTDKNGNMIYDGDIVSIPYVNPIGQLTDEENYRSEITFKNGEFVCRSNYECARLTDSISRWCKRGATEYISNVGEVADMLLETYLTIIGNIHQNKLL